MAAWGSSGKNQVQRWCHSASLSLLDSRALRSRSWKAAEAVHSVVRYPVWCSNGNKHNAQITSNNINTIRQYVIYVPVSISRDLLWLVVTCCDLLWPVVTCDIVCSCAATSIAAEIVQLNVTGYPSKVARTSLMLWQSCGLFMRAVGVC